MTELRLEIPKDILFNTVYADPPWPLDPTNEKKYAMTHRMHYDRMSLDEIKSVPVATTTSPDAILWLWTTNPAIEMALEVVEA